VNATTTTTTEPLTTRLNNGATVLARLYKGKPIARHYTNLTQARAAQRKLGEGWGVCCWGRPFYVTRVDADGMAVFPPKPTPLTMAGRVVTKDQIRATLKLLQYFKRFRESGFAACADPLGTMFQAQLTRAEAQAKLEYLLDCAIDRRAGWVEDPHAFVITMPVNGKLPWKASGDAARHLRQLGHRINSNVRVYRSELGEWGAYLERKLPDRFVRPGDE
jgi:hypothetical protein